MDRCKMWVGGKWVDADSRTNHAIINPAAEPGTKLALGGKGPKNPPPNRGSYVMPAVLTEGTGAMKIAREEIFGPAACSFRFSSEPDVLKKANGSRHGLCGSVLTGNGAKGVRLGNQMRVGSFWVNQHNYLATGFPRRGSNESGVHGMLEFTELKMMCLEMIE